ncbi:hypothetical protein AgCh_031482 [Apium graveolens]
MVHFLLQLSLEHEGLFLCIPHRPHLEKAYEDASLPSNDEQWISGGGNSSTMYKRPLAWDGNDRQNQVLRAREIDPKSLIIEPVFSVASTPLKEFQHSETAQSTLTCGSHSDAKPISPLSHVPAWKEDFSRIKLTSFDKLLQQICSSIKNVRL